MRAGIKMVGANGFEPSTSWSRTRKSENLKPCGCRTYKPHHPKNPASIGPQSPQRKWGSREGICLRNLAGFAATTFLLRCKGICFASTVIYSKHSISCFVFYFFQQ